MSFRILHTSDWHLGKRVGDFSREVEHQAFLKWLLQTIEDQKVDCLVIAGDIFDTKSPGPATREFYYQFLHDLSKTSCKHTVIVGGNHDSAAVLDAPRQLLNAFGVKVIGGAREDSSDEVLTLEEDGKVDCIVGAVPFLKDGDLRSGSGTPDHESLKKQLIEGLSEHYQKVVDTGYALAQEHKVPLVLTGHLYAQGCQLSESTRDIHIGNLASVGSQIFVPDKVAYVALGHLHKTQKVGSQEKIRYSGSPLPLAFDESNQKYVLLVDLEQGEETKVEKLEIPLFSELRTLQGQLSEIIQQITDLEVTENTLSLYLNLQLTDIQKFHPIHSIQESLDGHAQKEKMKLVKVSMPQAKLNLVEDSKSFDELSLNPKELFHTLIEQNEWQDEEKEILTRLHLALDQVLENESENQS